MMTEVVPPTNVPTGQELVTVRHYEAGPPAGLELVEPGETIATTKEEEWISKKKTELTTTRQIETRVKRQVVLEDGKVVEDSGPIVTTNTSEDTEKQEHQQTELRRLGDDEPDSGTSIEGAKKDWVSVPNPDGIVKEVKERRVVSREETKERTETEDIKHLGDITDEDFLTAVHSGEPDLRPVLNASVEKNLLAVSTGPRIVHESTKTKKVIDTEDTSAVSSLKPDGKLVTETKKITEHEEVKDQEVPDGQEVVEKEVETSQKYIKTKDEELVEYLADGVKIGEEMRYKAETMEGEKFGEGEDFHNWDSLSTRMRRTRRQQAHRSHLQKTKGVDDQIVGPPLDRKDALTKKPLDFDEEEETRKAETSKWLENHFGSESTRSSRDSIDEDEPQVQHKSFFNVTIKSQPTRVEATPPKSYVATINTNQRVYSPSPEPERIPVRSNGYYQGISEWSERRQEEFERYKNDGYPNGVNGNQNGHNVYNGHHNGYHNGHHNGYSERVERVQKIETPVQRHATQFRMQEEPEELPERPVPPERRRAMERRQQRSSQDSNRYDSGYRTHSRNEMSRDSHDEPQDEPPPDYSPPPTHHTPPPSPPPNLLNKKSYQRTRFANQELPPPQQQKVKHGNIIGQSIRKLVGKIRSASAERKNKQRANKRSPSPPTYQQYNVVDHNIPRRSSRDSETVMTETKYQQNTQKRNTQNGSSPVQRYYLGEDPFGGSIYGRENKYDGVKPARTSSRSRHHRSTQHIEDEARSHSTLGRFSKSTSRLQSGNAIDYTRTAQTLPRNIHSEREHHQHAHQSPPTRLVKNDHSDNTINVSIINTVSPKRPLVNGAPAKPARSYKSSLTRSKSFNVVGVENGGMYKSNPQLHRLDENPIGLKSPGIVSSISRSQRDLTIDPEVDYNTTSYSSRFVKNGYDNSESKKVFMKSLKERAPELFKTLNSDEEENAKKWQSKPVAYSTPLKSSRIANYNSHDVYDPPTRLKSMSPVHTVIRRGSNSTDDYSETYHITSRSDDPKRPSVTDTVQSFSKKTVPTKNGRSMQTIESTETKTVTRSRYRPEPVTSNIKYIENGNSKYSRTNNGGVVIEVKNYRN